MSPGMSHYTCSCAVNSLYPRGSIYDQTKFHYTIFTKKWCSGFFSDQSITNYGIQHFQWTTYSLCDSFIPYRESSLISSLHVFLWTGLLKQHEFASECVGEPLFPLFPRLISAPEKRKKEIKIYDVVFSLK